MSTLSIRAETPGDREAIDRVQRDAFSDPVIPQLIARLRGLMAPLPTISLVAEGPESVLGHVILSHSWIDAPAALADILVLSPLGVAPAAQGRGIGTKLLAAAVEAASRTPAPLLLLEGDPRFYGPRGFEPARGIRRPSLRIPEAALQMVRLPGHRAETTGTLVYRELWWELDCVGLR